jgi:hypothetical protein
LILNISPLTVDVQLSCIALKKPSGKNKECNSVILWNTPITHWDNLGETPSTYLCLQYFFVKTMWENQEISIYLYAYCLVKNLSMRNSCKTNKWKEYNVMHFIRNTYRGSPPKPYKSLSLLIPIHFTHLLNIAKGNDFVNKSAWLSQDFVCKILIFPWCCSSSG